MATRKAGGGRRVRINVTGVPSIDRKLRTLPDKVARKVLRQAIRKGLKPVRAEAQRLVPVDSGLTKRSIKVRAWPKRRRGQVALEVRTADGDYQGETFYAAFVEFGHFQGPRAAGGRRTWVPERPFMRPAFDNKKRAARKVAIREIHAGIAREVRALGKT